VRIVKVAKPNQDMRFDVPVIGRETTSVAAEAKIRVIALEAGRTLLLEKEDVILAAQNAKQSFDQRFRVMKPQAKAVQEALQDVVRHSGATVAEVRLTGTKDYLELDVADPGRGFRAEDNHAGLGLISMRERVHHLGGRIVFHTHPGGGTRIGVRLPIHASRRVGIRRHIA